MFNVFPDCTRNIFCVHSKKFFTALQKDLRPLASAKVQLNSQLRVTGDGVTGLFVKSSRTAWARAVREEFSRTPCHPSPVTRARGVGLVLLLFIFAFIVSKIFPQR